MKYPEWLEADINDTVEILNDDDQLVVADVVAKHYGWYQSNDPPYTHHYEDDLRIKVRNHDGAFWSTISRVNKIVITADDSFEAICITDGLSAI